jgi:hypothetical protein
LNRPTICEHGNRIGPEYSSIEQEMVF